VVSFRFDYRINGRRESLVIGQYDSGLGARKPRGLEELDYGMSVTLAEARLLLCFQGKGSCLPYDAGVLHEARLCETSDEHWDTILDTNLIGPYLYSQACLPALRGRELAAPCRSRRGRNSDEAAAR